MSVVFEIPTEHRVANLDLSAVMRNLAGQSGGTATELSIAEGLYRKFLILKHRLPDTILPPMAIVDDVWHAHMAITDQYAVDCAAIFGRRLPHREIAEDEAIDLEEGFAQTKLLYQQQFSIDFAELPLPPQALVRANCV